MDWIDAKIEKPKGDCRVIIARPSKYGYYTSMCYFTSQWPDDTNKGETWWSHWSPYRNAFYETDLELEKDVEIKDVAFWMPWPEPPKM